MSPGSGSIAVIVDSTVDLPEGVAERDGISMVPLVVNWDNQTYRDKLDISTDDFYARLGSSKTLPRTGAPSLAAFEAAFRERLAEHAGVVCLVMPGGLSATFDVAQRAAASVDPARISVIDTLSVTRCSGWLAEEAAGLAQQGASLADITSQVEASRSRMRLLAVLDTLEFLQRGGRIGRAQAFAGTLLNLKPIVEVRDGAVLPRERVRTMLGAIRRVVEMVASSGDIERIAALSGSPGPNVDELDRQVRERFPSLTVERGNIGSVLATHAGPGVLGVAFMLRQG